jgi:hypothetical protein
MTPERAFRVGTVAPFLKTLKNSFWLPIQQIGICGDPDYIGFCPGGAVGLELKALRGKHAALQKWKGLQIVRTGHFYIKADPTNWLAVTYLLAKLDQGEKCD